MMDGPSQTTIEVAERSADGQARIGELVTAIDAARNTYELFCQHYPNSPVGNWYAARAISHLNVKMSEIDLVVASNLCAAVATASIRWNEPAWEQKVYSAYVKYYPENADRWLDFFWEALLELTWDDFIMYPGWMAERNSQASLLRDIFGNSFRPLLFDPAHRTPTVIFLAQAAYDERHLPSGELDPHLLAVLADALEETGATSELLAHLRSPGPHVRGCWLLDLVLRLS
jgi:hypothetical protein